MQSATVFNLVRQEHRIKHIDHVLPHLDRESALNRGARRNSLVIDGEKARSGVVVLTRRRGGAQDGVPYTSAVSIRNLAEPDDIDDKAKRTYFQDSGRSPDQCYSFLQPSCASKRTKATGAERPGTAGTISDSKLIASKLEQG